MELKVAHVAVIYWGAFCGYCNTLGNFFYLLPPDGGIEDFLGSNCSLGLKSVL